MTHMWYKKKPVIVMAMQWTGENFDALVDFAGDDVFMSALPGGTWILKVATQEGFLNAQPGCWIIKGVKGEHYPCSDEVFQITYESTHAPATTG
jgi:hypothetical protein